MGGAFEVVQDLPPGAVSGCAATVAFVHHDQIKEIRAELSVGVRILVVIGQPLIQGQVNLEGLVDLLFADDRHPVLEMLKVAPLGLVDQSITISKK